MTVCKALRPPSLFLFIQTSSISTISLSFEQSISLQKPNMLSRNSDQDLTDPRTVQQSDHYLCKSDSRDSGYSSGVNVDHKRYRDAAPDGISSTAIPAARRIEPQEPSMIIFEAEISRIVAFPRFAAQPAAQPTPSQSAHLQEQFGYDVPLFANETWAALPKSGIGGLLFGSIPSAAFPKAGWR